MPRPSLAQQGVNQTGEQGLILSNILPSLAGIKHLMIIDIISGYHNLKLDEQSTHLTSFSCPPGRYRIIKLLFGMIPAGDMLQKKTDELFQVLSNVFGIADDILISGSGDLGTYHDATLDKVLRICRKAILNYLCKFSLVSTEVCKPLWKPM